MTERLTNLAAVKDWLGINSDTSDTGLMRLIDAASQFTLNYLNRDSFQAKSYTQNFQGNRKRTTLIRNWPIVSVSSVGVDGRLIPASTFGVGGKPSDGYSISDARNAPQSVDLHGCYWYYGYCQVIYIAGFQSTQTNKIPAPAEGETYGMITAGVMGVWSSDQGVTIDGTLAPQVDADPAAGEYMVDEWGNYSFNTADQGKTSVISYTYTPFDVSFAVTQLIGGFYNRKDRIGVLSKTLGGQETITFLSTDMTDDIKKLLQNYKNEIPV